MTMPLGLQAGGGSAIEKLRLWTDPSKSASTWYPEFMNTLSMPLLPGSTLA